MGSFFGGMPQPFTQQLSSGYYRPPISLAPATQPGMTHVAAGTVAGGYTPPATGLTGILNLIKKGESAASGGYNALGMAAKPVTDLTKMSINEVMKFGKAAGAYQIIPSTMQGLVKKLGLTGEEKFTPELQERLGTQLVKNRGYDDYRAGKMQPSKFAQGLADEWASLPMISGAGKGLSRYEGDKYGNHANIKVDEMKSVLGINNGPTT